MSRVGRMPIDIPAGVNVNLDGHVITVKGPKGELTRTLHQDMKITVADNVITVERPSDDKNHRALHGLTRALIANMVNLAIRLSVALICAPRFGIDFVWLAVPAGWLANFLVSYAALRKSWPGEKVESSRIFS